MENELEMIEPMKRYVLTKKFDKYFRLSGRVTVESGTVFVFEPDWMMTLPAGGRVYLMNQQMYLPDEAAAMFVKTANYKPMTNAS